MVQFGEYVSLGKVESVLKTCPLVDNVCIYGDSSKSYVVALIVPDRNKLTELAKKLGKAETEFDLLRKDKDVTGAVLRELVMYGRQLRLEKFEQPGAVTVCDELWTPGRKIIARVLVIIRLTSLLDTGLVTAAFKLKRKPLQTFYQADINRMYGCAGTEM